MAAQCLGVTLDASAVSLLSQKRRSVFIVHGRDNAALFWLKNFLSERKVTPIVLRDQPRTGAEILALLDEKIDKCAAGFVLLTPDDEGRLLVRPGAAEDKLQFRARQNVIFEAGLLCARFRDLSKVCFLKKGQIGIPTDMQGLLFEDLDEENPTSPASTASSRPGGSSANGFLRELANNVGRLGGHPFPTRRSRDNQSEMFLTFCPNIGRRYPLRYLASCQFSSMFLSL